MDGVRDETCDLLFTEKAVERGSGCVATRPKRNLKLPPAQWLPWSLWGG